MLTSEYRQRIGGRGFECVSGAGIYAAANDAGTVNVAVDQGAVFSTLAQLDRIGQRVPLANSGTGKLAAIVSAGLAALADAAKLIAFLALALDGIGGLRVGDALGFMVAVHPFRQTLGLAVWTGALGQLGGCLQGVI